MLPDAFDEPEVFQTWDGFQVSISTGLVNALLLTTTIETESLTAKATFTLPDGTELFSSLVLGTDVTGPYATGVVSVTTAGSVATLTNHAERAVNVFDIQLRGPDGSTRTVPVNSQLGAGTSTSIPVDGPVSTAYVSYEPVAERMRLKEMRIFAEDVITNVFFVNCVNFANHGLRTLQVRARLKGSDHQDLLDLAEGATAELALTLPLLTYLDARTLEYQVVQTHVDDEIPVHTSWREWDLQAQGHIITIGSDTLADRSARRIHPSSKPTIETAMNPLIGNGHAGDGATTYRSTARGISLHIGLNHVDPNEYHDENGDPWDGELFGCINDATDLQSLAEAQGFQTQLMTDNQATSSEVICAIGKAASELTSGDMFLLTYSGHGGQVPDVNSDEEEGLDETWCLFDRELIDDELYNLWSQFAAGVRIFVLSDSCHSGTVVRMTFYKDLMGVPAMRDRYERVGMRVRNNYSPSFRLMPEGVQMGTYRDNKPTYDALQWSAGRSERAVIGSSVLLISGCQDNQLSADGDGNGLFTETLLRVWNNGSYEGNYETFARAIVDEMPATQSPNFYKVGQPNPTFEAQKPFTIGEAIEPIPSDGSPSIMADAGSYERGGTAPTFTIQTGANPYYIVEVASDYNLFVQRPSGNTDAFYATYFDSSAPSRLTDSSYTLPDAAWQMLSGADRLYYRIGTTSSQTGWDNYTVSTYDGIEPPSLEIMEGESDGGGDESEMPSITADADSYERSGAAPTFTVETGSHPYYIFEVADDYNLFVQRPSGNTNSFYATYFDGSAPARLTGSSYTLPDDAWSSLSGADRLYYRIGTTTSQTGWDDYTVSTYDGIEPTSIEITDAEDRIPPARAKKTTKKAGAARTKAGAMAARKAGSGKRSTESMEPPRSPEETEEPMWESTRSSSAEPADQPEAARPYKAGEPAGAL